jgi:hypothetical protein
MVQDRPLALASLRRAARGSGGKGMLQPLGSRSRVRVCGVRINGKRRLPRCPCLAATDHSARRPPRPLQHSWRCSRARQSTTIALLREIPAGTPPKPTCPARQASQYRISFRGDARSRTSRFLRVSRRQLAVGARIATGPVRVPESVQHDCSSAAARLGRPAVAACHAAMAPVVALVATHLRGQGGACKQCGPAGPPLVHWWPHDKHPGPVVRRARPRTSRMPRARRTPRAVRVSV